MQIKFKKTKDHLPNLLKRLKALEKAGNVEIGYHPEQRDHPSGLHPAGLYAILAEGYTPNNLPARPVMQIGMIMNPIKSNINVKKFLKQYLSKIDRKTPPIKATKLLENIGGAYVEIFRGIFGSTHLEALSPSTVAYKTRMKVAQPNAPLIFDGTLRDMISYKVNGVLVTP